MTPAQRAAEQNRVEALAVYVEHGLAYAHRATGVTKSTLRRWAIEEGLDPAELAGAAAAQTAAATAASTARMDATRSELRETLLEKALDLLERMDAPHVEYLGRDAAPCKFERAPAKACQSYAVAAAILIDKFRLEMGEATERTSVSIEDRLRALSGLKDEVAQMRDRSSTAA